MQDQQDKDKGKGKGKFTMQLKTRFIMTCNPKRNRESVLSKFRSISNISEHGEAGGWVSFKYLSDRDGFDVVMECIRCETVVVRPNPKLPSDSQIQYPYHLE